MTLRSQFSPHLPSCTRDVGWPCPPQRVPGRVTASQRHGSACTQWQRVLEFLRAGQGGREKTPSGDPERVQATPGGLGQGALEGTTDPGRLLGPLCCPG